MDFFKKQATSFLSSQGEKKEEAPTTGEPKKDATPTKESEAPSYQELMGSANVLLDAAKSQVGGTKEQKLDTAKLADAAEDVLQAASHYGKLQGTQYEGYVKKAEDYLDTYQSRDGADVTPPAEELKKSAEEVKAAAPEVKPPAPEKTAEAPKPAEEKVEAPPKPSEE